MADLGSPTKKALSASDFEARQQGPVVDPEARMRRGLVSDALKDQMTKNAREGRANVSLGYATDRSLARSRSEASVMNPPFSNASTRFQSGIETVRSVASQSPLRAGPRDNELQPMWEKDHQLEGVRTMSRGQMGLSAATTLTEGEMEDGFTMDEMKGFGGGGGGGASPSKRTRDEDGLLPLSESAEDELEGTDVEDAMDDDDDDDGPPSPSPTPARLIRPIRTRRAFQYTQSVPVIGAYGSRPTPNDDFTMDAEF